MSNQQRKFAVFDIDGTIIRWQLYHAIVDELAHRGLLPDGAAETIEVARMTWKKRAHSESYRAYEHKLIHVYLQALETLTVPDFLSVVDTVFEKHKDQVYTYTRDLIGQLKNDGYLLFAISGSQQEIVEKLAGYYGFDDCVGNILYRKGDRFTGEESGIMGKKGTVLQALVDKHAVTFRDSIAVGDSEGDIEMFELVERPIAFNPTAGLFQKAKTEGWTIVVERKSVIYRLRPENDIYTLT